MEKRAKWIWYEGEFETYHHELLSLRREEFGAQRAAFWDIARPYTVVRFKKTVDVKEDTVLHVKTRGQGFLSLQDGDYPFYPLNTDIPLKKGRYVFWVEVFNRETFPSIFIDNKYCFTDETWAAGLFERKVLPAACEPAFCSEKDDPAVFPFRYRPLTPVATEHINNGVLYDFGKETFGIVTIARLSKTDDVRLTYGETREETLDYAHAIIKERLTRRDRLIRPSRAFRFLFIENKDGEPPLLKVKYEYLPIKNKAAFSCDNPLVKGIWETCAYTFELNSREFYLDGIKRDRWVWAGDAYQSFRVNRYFNVDDGIIKRTIKALLGKPPYERHVNKINDYSAFLIAAVWEYYFSSGDVDFLKAVWEKVKALYAFIVGRLDGRGYVVKRDFDWIFIDWGDVDKGDQERGDATCAEQIMLWVTYEAMEKISAALGETCDCKKRAKALKKRIFSDFYDMEKGCFIDCKDSGKSHVSRQANVLAVEFGLTDKRQSEKIAESVVLNDEIPPITTPYFKFYELSALCRLCYLDKIQSYLE